MTIETRVDFDRQEIKFPQRETEVLQGLIDGLDDQKIVDRMGISANTVTQYKTKIGERMDSTGERSKIFRANLTRAVVYAVRKGLISTDGLPKIPLMPFTGRQKEVLRFAGQGFCLTEIRQELVIVPKTLECHIAEIRQRLGIESWWRICAWAAKEENQSFL